MQIEKYINNIYCGDCLEFMAKLPDNCVDMILTDPPYSVPVVTGVSRENIKNYADFSISESYFRNIAIDYKRILKETGCLFLFCDEVFYPSLFRAFYNYFDTKLLIWDKQQMGLGYHWRRGFELIMFGHNGKTEKKTSNKLDIIKFKRVTNEERKHPAQKPTNLLMYLIDNFSNKNDIIADFFLGSGSTAVACERLGRQWLGCEISQEYCDIANARIEAERSQLKLPI